MASKSIGLLNIVFGADLRGFDKAMKKAQKNLKKFGNNLKRTGKNLSTNLTLPIMALGVVSVKAFDKQQKAIAQVEAGLKSTGNQVGLTSKELQKMAADLQKTTLFGDEEILQGATAQLLTFTNIAGEQFKRTQEVALDLATRLDGDLKSASIMLGKALNDPVANLSALSRAGIQFSTKQKAVVKSLVETNRLADAQTIILEELEKQYGGSAEAAAAAGLGPIQQLGNALSDMSEDIGAILLPMIQDLANWIKKIADKFDNLGDSTKKTIVVIALVAAALGPVLMMIGQMSIGISALIPIVKGLTVAMMSNPYLAVGALIVGFIVHLNTFGKKTKTVTKAQKKLNTELRNTKNLIGTVAEIQGKVSNLSIMNLRQQEELLTTLKTQKEAIVDKRTEIELWAKTSGAAEKAGKKIKKLREQIKETDSEAGKAVLFHQIKKVNDEFKDFQISKFGTTFEDLSEKNNTLAKNIGTTIKSIKGLKKEGLGDEELDSGDELEFSPIPGIIETEFLFNMSPAKESLDELITNTGYTFQTIEEQAAEATQKMIGKFQNFADKVKMIMSSLSGVISAVNEKEQAEFDIWRESQEEKTDILDGQMERELERVEESGMSDKDKADAKIAIEERYAEKRGAIDDMIDKKEKALKRKQAIRDKAMKLASAIMSTAEAIMGAVAASPLTGGLPWSALVAALGAAQIGTIASTPIPFEMGGLVSGPTLGLIGEGSGTSAFNPEVVSPLDKLMGMMGTSNVNVHGRIQGDNIVLVSDKAEISRERFI